MGADERVLDGNAAGGMLAAIFPFEMTAVAVTCAGCGMGGPLGELRVYASAMGTVARCPGCDAVLIRVTEVRGEYWLDLRGARSLRLPAAGRG
jgi:hypothetical protein